MPRRVEKALPGTVGPTVAQLLAEELITEMVRRQFDIIGLLELEREVFESVGGIAEDMGATQSIPAAALAATLIDQAFRKVEAEWREQRGLCTTDECVCCAMEIAEQARKRQRGGSGGGGGGNGGLS